MLIGGDPGIELSQGACGGVPRIREDRLAALGALILLPDPLDEFGGAIIAGGEIGRVDAEVARLLCRTSQVA